MPIPIILAALSGAISAGVAPGLTDATKSAITDAYSGLKTLIKDKFGHSSEAAVAVEKLEANPESKARRDTLDEELTAVKADASPDLVDAARKLLALLEAVPQAASHVQTANDSTGVAQADRGGTATVTFNAPPPARHG